MMFRSSGSGDDETDTGESLLLPPLSSELGSPTRVVGRSSRHNSGESALATNSRPLSPLPFFTGASSHGEKGTNSYVVVVIIVVAMAVDSDFRH